MIDIEEIRRSIAHIEQHIFHSSGNNAVEDIEQLIEGIVSPLFSDWQQGAEPEAALQPLIIRPYLLKALLLISSQGGKESEVLLDLVAPYLDTLTSASSEDTAFVKALEKGIRGTILAMQADYTKALDVFDESVSLIREFSLDPLKSRFLGNLAMLHERLGNSQLSKEMFEEAIEHARHEKNNSELCRLLINLGAAYQSWENEPEAYLCFQEALPIAEQLNHTHFIAICNLNISSALYDTEKKKQAYEHLKIAEEIGIQTNNIYVLYLVESFLGIIYADEGKPEKGLEAHFKALEYAEKLQQHELVMKEYSNIANRYSMMQEFDKALKYYLQALVWAERSGGIDNIVHIKGNLAILLYQEGRQEEAFVQAQGAREIAAQHDLRGHYSLNTARLACIVSDKRFSKCSLDDAHRYIQEGLAAEDSCPPNIFMKVVKEASIFYEKIEEWQKSNTNWQKYYQIKEIVDGEAARRHLLLHEKEREAALLRREKELLSEHNRQLKEANDLKTRLLGIAAHDLKNPLAAIQGLAQILLHSVEGEDKELLEMILLSSSNMKQLVSDLLDSTAAASGQLSLQKSLASLDSLLDISISRLSHQAANKKQTIHNEVSAECVLYIDESKIVQVFDNIIGNAVKYSPFNSEIYVQAVLDDDTVTISIADQGQGLSPEDIEKMFGQFQKLSSTPTGGEVSTGLGLYIVKQIVELHDGTVWAESEGKGQGATFFIRLPLAIPEDIRFEFFGSL